jgi:hypothetical protein
MYLGKVQSASKERVVGIFFEGSQSTKAEMSSEKGEQFSGVAWTDVHPMDPHSRTP